VQRTAQSTGVLVAPVAVALAVGVVLVDDDLLPRREQAAGGLHRPGQHTLPRLVGAHELEGVRALRGRVLGMGVVDVVARAVGEHRVDEVGLDLGGSPTGRPRVTPRSSSKSQPTRCLDVAADQSDEASTGLGRCAALTPNSVSIPQTLGMATGGSLPGPTRTDSRYLQVLARADRLDGAVGSVPLHQGAHVHDALALLARDPRPVIGVGCWEVLVLAKLLLRTRAGRRW
jgi:hypothetical protein